MAKNSNKKGFWRTVWNNPTKKVLLVSSIISIIARLFERFLEELVLDRVVGWGNIMIDRWVSTIPEGVFKHYLEIIFSWVFDNIFNLVSTIGVIIILIIIIDAYIQTRKKNEEKPTRKRTRNNNPNKKQNENKFWDGVEITEWSPRMNLTQARCGIEITNSSQNKLNNCYVQLISLYQESNDEYEDIYGELKSNLPCNLAWQINNEVIYKKIDIEKTDNAYVPVSYIQESLGFDYFFIKGEKDFKYVWETHESRVIAKVKIWITIGKETISKVLYIQMFSNGKRVITEKITNELPVFSKKAINKVELAKKICDLAEDFWCKFEYIRTNPTKDYERDEIKKGRDLWLMRRDNAEESFRELTRKFEPNKYEFDCRKEIEDYLQKLYSLFQRYSNAIFMWVDLKNTHPQASQDGLVREIFGVEAEKTIEQVENIVENIKELLTPYIRGKQ